MWNDDVEISLWPPTETMDGFFRQRRGRRGDLRPRRVRHDRFDFGELPYKPGDYAVIPRGTTYRFAPDDGEQRTSSSITRPDRDPAAIPKRVRADASEHAPVLPPRHPSPTELDTHASAASSTSRCCCAAATRRTCSTITRSTSSAGRLRLSVDVSIHDSSRSPAASTCRRLRTRRSRGRNFVISRLPVRLRIRTAIRIAVTPLDAEPDERYEVAPLERLVRRRRHVDAGRVIGSKSWMENVHG